MIDVIEEKQATTGACEQGWYVQVCKCAMIADDD